MPDLEVYLVDFEKKHPDKESVCTEGYYVTSKVAEDFDPNNIYDYLGFGTKETDEVNCPHPPHRQRLLHKMKSVSYNAGRHWYDNGSGLFIGGGTPIKSFTDPDLPLVWLGRGVPMLWFKRGQGLSQAINSKKNTFSEHCRLWRYETCHQCWQNEFLPIAYDICEKYPSYADKLEKIKSQF